MLPVNVSEPWFADRVLQALDIIQLHQEILNLKNAKLLQFDATKDVSEWLEKLRKSMPF